MARKRNIKLIKLRMGLDMTQIEISKKIGVSDRTYGNAEAGNRVSETTKALIADFHGVAVSELFKEVS